MGNYVSDYNKYFMIKFILFLVIFLNFGRNLVLNFLFVFYNNNNGKSIVSAQQHKIQNLGQFIFSFKLTSLEFLEVILKKDQ